MSKQKTILISPLDWGLGHATRCIPIINEFLATNCKVIIATSGKQKALLVKEFPNLQFLDLKSYEVEYPKKGQMALKMLLQLPKIIKAIKDEHKWLDRIIEEYNIDIVVSDNRYGLWTKKIPCILVTHQIFVNAPFGEWLIEKVAQHYFKNFSQIWIPDFQGEDNLSGILSHKKGLTDKFKFIGVLSRFSSLLREQRSNPFEEEFDIMAIISGPEPQRTIFEQIIIEQFQKAQLKALVLRGLPEINVIANEVAPSAQTEKIASSVLLPRNDDRNKIFNHLETDEFLKYLQKTNLVISRSGYSTLMDLAVLGKKAIFIPTPGQTEQEYLAQYHHWKGHFYSQKQNGFDLEKALVESKNYTGIEMELNGNLLSKQIQQLLN